MSQINIVTFDAAGTLLQPWPSVGAVYGKTARNMGINVDDYDIEIRFRNAFATAESSNKIKYGNEKSFWKNIVEITFQPFANKFLGISSSLLTLSTPRILNVGRAGRGGIQIYGKQNFVSILRSLFALEQPYYKMKGVDYGRFNRRTTFF